MEHMLDLDPKLAVKRLLARMGFQIQRTSAVETLDLHMLRVFAARAINCVLDVGAHVGDFGRELRRIGYRGHIISFEPVARNFEGLQRTASGDPRWRTFPFALGERSGHADINVFHGSTFHSLLTASEFGRETFGGRLAIERIERIEIKRLDDVLDSCLEGIPMPRLYLKMDTQGYDLAVVEGAGATLGRVLALQTEVALQPIYQGMSTTLCNTIPELRKWGFEVTGLFPVSRDEKDGLQIIELDCVMIRSRTVSVPTT
jgi:FkbM family methyltransferase